MRHFIKRIWSHLWGHSTKNAKRAVADARQRQARRQAEVDYHATMEMFFRGEADAIDHTKAWWDYASTKQAEAEHFQDREVEIRRLRAAIKNTEACKERYRKLIEPTN